MGTKDTDLGLCSIVGIMMSKYIKIFSVWNAVSKIYANGYRSPNESINPAGWGRGMCAKAVILQVGLEGLEGICQGNLRRGRRTRQEKARSRA